MLGFLKTNVMAVHGTNEAFAIADETIKLILIKEKTLRGRLSDRQIDDTPWKEIEKRYYTEEKVLSKSLVELHRDIYESALKVFSIDYSYKNGVRAA